MDLREIRMEGGCNWLRMVSNGRQECWTFGFCYLIISYFLVLLETLSGIGNNAGGLILMIDWCSVILFCDSVSYRDGVSLHRE
jgi:hypothetical protein